MGTRIKNVDPSRSERFITEANVHVAWGESAEVDSDLATRLAVAPEWEIVTAVEAPADKKEAK